MMGCDTSYARGWTDDEIVRTAQREERVVLTRDRQLSTRVRGAVLLTSSRLEDQVRASWAALPGVPTEVRFERCTLCNGLLEALPAPGPAERSEGVPWDRVDAGLELYRCRDCSHIYWDGSHTDAVRRRLHAWAAVQPE
jgi:uncharacterized protein with PIN domain